MKLQMTLLSLADATAEPAILVPASPSIAEEVPVVQAEEVQRPDTFSSMAAAALISRLLTVNTFSEAGMLMEDGPEAGQAGETLRSRDFACKLHQYLCINPRLSTEYSLHSSSGIGDSNLSIKLKVLAITMKSYKRHASLNFQMWVSYPFLAGNVNCLAISSDSIHSMA